MIRFFQKTIGGRRQPLLIELLRTTNRKEASQSERQKFPPKKKKNIRDLEFAARIARRLKQCERGNQYVLQLPPCPKGVLVGLGGGSGVVDGGGRGVFGWREGGGCVGRGVVWVKGGEAGGGTGKGESGGGGCRAGRVGDKSAKTEARGKVESFKWGTISKQQGLVGRGKARGS